jgi:hypothetical protein
MLFILKLATFYETFFGYNIYFKVATAAPAPEHPGILSVEVSID